MPRAFWFRNRPSDEPMQFDKSEKYPGWFRYRTAGFLQNLTSNVSPFSSIFWEDRENCSVTQFAMQVVMNSHYRGHGEAPTELTLIQRQKIADAISTLELKAPELPEWLFPTPVAAIGEIPVPDSGECGSVICPITEEFALEIEIQWSLHYRDATKEEIAILEEQLK